MKTPCALTIAGSDSGGGAGIQADVKTFATMGVHGLCVIAAVTAQNTRGVEATLELPPEFVTRQLDTVMSDFTVKFAKTGMLSSAGIVKAVEAGLKKHRLKVVVDPVMWSATEAPLLREDALAAIKELISRAELVTPNLFEGTKLSGVKIRTRGDMRKAAREIAKLGPRAVLLKGGHLKGEVVTDVLYSDGKFEEFSGPRIKTEPTHGTGCSLSAAITAELAKGAELRAAVVNARAFLAEAIRERLHVGGGVMPVNQMAALLREAARYRAVDELWRAAQLLVANPRFVRLLPEVGSNMAMALPGAKSRSETYGLSGRFVKSGGRAVVTGFPEPSGSVHVANIVLTAMRHDPEIRSGMNIRYSPEIVRACRELGLRIGSFDRRLEPRGVKTMEWGTEQAIKRAGKVPDVIFDKGDVGKEAMVRVLGKSPLDVADRVLRLADKLYE